MHAYFETKRGSYYEVLNAERHDNWWKFVDEYYVIKEYNNYETNTVIQSNHQGIGLTDDQISNLIVLDVDMSNEY